MKVEEEEALEEDQEVAEEIQEVDQGEVVAAAGAETIEEVPVMVDSTKKSLRKSMMTTLKITVMVLKSENQSSATKRSSKQIKIVRTKKVNLAEVDSEEEDLIEGDSEEVDPKEGEEEVEAPTGVVEVEVVLIAENLLKQWTQKMETLKL